MSYFSKTYHIYIVSNRIRSVFYIGVTSDLYRRISEHASSADPNSFTSKYNCKYLIYYEEYQSVKEALAREKQLKKWSKQKKLDLIQELNPKLRDLSTSSRWQWKVYLMFSLTAFQMLGSPFWRRQYHHSEPQK